VLEKELSALASRLMETNLDEGKRVYLDRAKEWPKQALDDAQKAIDALSAAELRHHLEELLHLLSDAIARGPHHYIRFIGD